jgi:hypothetical protein
LGETDKHSSLLRKFVNYVRKKFYNISPCLLRYRINYDRKKFYLAALMLKPTVEIMHRDNGIHIEIVIIHCQSIGSGIIPDILSLKTTRAFWRQNTFTFNKPAPLGAKILRAFHWKCSTPFYS